MVYKLRMAGGGFALAKTVNSEACPGVGNVLCSSGDSPAVWTGAHWIGISGEFSLSVTSLDSVETRANLDETDEPWVTVWRRPKTFSYAGYADFYALFRKEVPSAK